MSSFRQLRCSGLTLLCLACLQGSRPASAAPGDQAQITIVIGAARCFVVRRPDGAMTIQDRVDRVHYVFAKHLGTPRAEFTLQKPAKESALVQIFLNGDHVINVTTNDARATGYRDPQDVAAIWKKTLESAFGETHALSDDPRK